MFELTANDVADLMQKHRAALTRFLARRIGCPDTIQDILQEMFIRLHGHRLREPVSNPRAFLFRVASNLATDHLRSRERRAEIGDGEDELARLPDESPCPEVTIFSQQRVALLKQAILELPPKCREVFILCKFEHYTYAQTARKLGISESTVIKHMVKALDHCKKRVVDDFQ